jgi:hypothetical protein
VAVVVDQLLGAWFWGVLVATGAATVLGGPLVSLLGAAGVALVLCLGAFLIPAAALWLELGLVAAVTRPARLREAASTALEILLARPGAVVALWGVTAVPAGFLAAGVQVLQSGAPGPGWAAASASGVAVLLVALVEALATLVRLDALAALVLDARGELPAPPPRPAPPPPAIPMATLVSSAEVVEARPVGPVSPWSGRDPSMNLQGFHHLAIQVKALEDVAGLLPGGARAPGDRAPPRGRRPAPERLARRGRRRVPRARAGGDRAVAGSRRSGTAGRGCSSWR